MCVSKTFFVENTNFLQGMGNTMFYRIKTFGDHIYIYIRFGGLVVPGDIPLLSISSWNVVRLVADIKSHHQTVVPFRAKSGQKH